MAYVYAAMWLIVGLILIFRLGKENRVFYVAGGFFLILSGWWIANIVSPEDLFAGTWGIVLRVITAVALVILCVVFWQHYQKDRAAFEKKKQAENCRLQKGNGQMTSLFRFFSFSVTRFPRR